MKYAYYPGCSLHSTGREYDVSLRGVCKMLGIELVEPKQWICCGSSSAHALSKILAISLPLQSLVEVKKLNINEVIVPCSACFCRFKIAQSEVKNNPELKIEIKKIIDNDLPENIKISHPLEIFSEKNILKKLPEFIKKDLKNLKVVSYYGCLLTRPPKIMQFDECEYPVSMDKILNAIGIHTLDWSYKTECCGSSFSLTRTDIVNKLCFDILEEASQVGADIISVACPLCHINLDMRQKEIENKYKKKFKIPILYFTQLIGLAFGIPQEELLTQKHLGYCIGEL